MLIREAKITEGYEIEALVKLCAEDSEDMMITPEESYGISQSMISGLTNTMVVEIDGKISGVVMGTRGVTKSSAHNMELAMCIHPDYRGMSLGTQLMGIFVNEFSYMNLIADAYESNDVIIKLLQGLNFKEVGRIPKGVRGKNEYKDKIILFYYG